MYRINEDVTIYYKQIHREYIRGKENFDKRFPIMEQRAKEMFKEGKITARSLSHLLKRLYYYKNMNEVRRWQNPAWSVISIFTVVWEVLFAKEAIYIITML